MKGEKESQKAGRTGNRFTRGVTQNEERGLWNYINWFW